MRIGLTLPLHLDALSITEGIGNNRDAMNRLDDDEKDAVGIADAIGREPLAGIPAFQ